MKTLGSQSQLDSQLAAAGSKLTLAPILEGLEKKHSSTVFAKVDVDQAQDCAEHHKVTAMPTILFFKQKAEVGRVVGANTSEIQALIKKHEGGDSFLGTGHSLGGSSTDGGASSGSILGDIQVRLLDGSTIRGNFESSHSVQQVHEFVQANLDARGAKAPGFKLMTNFPRTIYEDEALKLTLEEAKLTPRAQLIVKA
ncbi:hypothetical protein CPC16_004811 [Podila verticillata]|nr:hypothetical protein CPC16_004811 [Podila verticillata]